MRHTLWKMPLCVIHCTDIMVQLWVRSS
jgi:hypothetical protein